MRSISVGRKSQEEKIRDRSKLPTLNTVFRKYKILLSLQHERADSMRKDENYKFQQMVQTTIEGI